MPRDAWNNTVAFVVDGEWFSMQDVLDLKIVPVPGARPYTIGELLVKQRAQKAEVER